MRMRLVVGRGRHSAGLDAAWFGVPSWCSEDDRTHADRAEGGELINGGVDHAERIRKP
jgi:hypothetical protein